MTSKKQQEITGNLKSQERWLRVFYVVFFFAAASVAGFLVVTMALFQVVYTFVASRPDSKLLSLGDGLAHYFQQIIQYVTFNSEDKPFPFSDWPTHGKASRSRKPKSTRASEKEVKHGHEDESAVADKSGSVPKESSPDGKKGNES